MNETAPVPMQGTISAHPRGFGFVKDDDGDDYFVSPPQMRSLVPGDRVSFSVIARPNSDQLSATVHEVLARPQTFWLGRLEPGEAGGTSYRFRADDACHAVIETDTEQPVEPLDVVQVCIPAGEGVGKPRVQAVLAANLGPRNDHDFDVRYAIARWRLPVAFDDAALAQARGHPEPSKARAMELGFADLTDLPFVTVDNESTQDFDDALCIVDHGEHGTLHVAIAHVSHYVMPGTPLDLAARSRGTSVYLPDRSVPMLPTELSNGLCSLNPGVLRYAVVCSLSYSKQGALSGYSFAEAVIRSVARLSYREVADRRVPAQVEPMLHALWQWFDAQQPARARRGLIEFRNEEPRLVVTPDGSYAIEWARSERSNELVEEAMLAANRAAAAHLTLRGAGLLFRHQEGLDPTRWEETRRWLHERGIAAPEAPTLVDLRALLQSVALSPLRPQVEFRLRQAMTPAVYDEQQSSHFSLGFAAYTHFTSPIRRYPDLLVHRLLLGEPVDMDAALSDHLSARAKAARQTSRYPWERLKRRLAWRSGERDHDGQLTSCSARGIKAALARWEVLAFVGADTLEPQGWTWDRARDLWCRGEAELDLGSPLRLRLLSLQDEGPLCELNAQLIG